MKAVTNVQEVNLTPETPEKEREMKQANCLLSLSQDLYNTSGRWGERELSQFYRSCAVPLMPYEL